METIIASVSER
jgi:hypothetical protein